MKLELDNLSKDELLMICKSLEPEMIEQKLRFIAMKRRTELANTAFKHYKAANKAIGDAQNIIAKAIKEKHIDTADINSAIDMLENYKAYCDLVEDYKIAINELE